MKLFDLTLHRCNPDGGNEHGAVNNRYATFLFSQLIYVMESNPLQGIRQCDGYAKYPPKTRIQTSLQIKGTKEGRARRHDTRAKGDQITIGSVYT